MNQVRVRFNNPYHEGANKVAKILQVHKPYLNFSGGYSFATMTSYYTYDLSGLDDAVVDQIVTDLNKISGVTATKQS